MSHFKRWFAATLVMALALTVGSVQPALAYSCEAEFTKAEQSIQEAEAAVTPDSDSRIKAMLAEAKGLLAAATVSHREASERHVGENGKYMHGDAVRKARWAQTLASEVVFLATGEPR